MADKGVLWGLGWRDDASDISATAPVRLEICLLNIGGCPAQEWPIQILTQEEYEQRVWFKDLEQSVHRVRVLGGYAALQRAARLSGAHLRCTRSVLLPWQAHSPYAGWDGVLDWPNGYARAMQYNLAMELAPQYRVEPSQTI